jgi:hypothetical protein
LRAATRDPMAIINPDWRWMHDRDDTPWYPSARLFRQTVARDWDGVIGRVHDELSSRVAQFT